MREEIDTNRLSTRSSYIFDVEIFYERGKGHWAQALILVHGWDDVLWTDDPKVAAEAIEECIRKVLE